MSRCWTFLGQQRLCDYTTVSIARLHTFFDWLLRQQCGKGGRKRRGTKFASSLGTYWKVFRLVYERATSSKIDGKLNRSMHKVGPPLTGLAICVRSEAIYRCLESSPRSTV